MALNGLITAIFGKPRKRLIDRLKKKKNILSKFKQYKSGFLWGHIKFFGVLHRIVLIPVVELDGIQKSYDEDDAFFKDIRRFAEMPYETIKLKFEENREIVYREYVGLAFPKSRMYRKYFQEPKNEREIYG
jgi:hypothetical protein